jgi:AcrR family transcriptional regulator
VVIQPESGETDGVRRLDRRHRRRVETIEQVLDVAADVMGEQGAAGLSLGEVARRMGIRTPSLYVYFESKNALYDALFERGWRDVQGLMNAFPDAPDNADELASYVLGFGQAFARWAVEHPAYAQLMFWRPVPGYEPSPSAYSAAIEVLATARERMALLQERHVLRPDVDIDRSLQIWTVLISGVVSQQLANAPDEPFDGGRFTALMPEVVDMFLTYFGPPSGGSSNRRTKGRRPHAVEGRSNR